MLKDSGVSFTSRHEVIKREALLETFQSYYGAGKQGRPDVQYESFPPIVIDLSIVHTKCLDKHEGYNAQQRAQQKESKHGEAVNAGGATFVPFIMETDGLLHYGAIEVIKLSRQLTYHMRSSFVNDMRRTLSIALAKENSKAVCTALTRSNCYASMGGNSCLRRRVPLV